MATVTDAQKIEILYNKSLGAGTSAAGAGFSTLPPASALAKIIPSLQIFSDPVPAVAPTDLVEDTTFIANLPVTAQRTAQAGTNYAPKRLVSTQYPHIVKYVYFQLFPEQTAQSYVGTLALGSNPNYLSQAIPFNYDSGGSYGIEVRTLEGTFQNRPSDSTIIPWYFDKDVGLLTFYGANRPVQLAKNPIMSFWRYEGGFGLGSGGSGSGSTGATGAQGPAGKDGKDGGSGGGGGIYANDAWLTENLIGQPPAVTFGAPVSKSTAIYIPWSYPEQRQVGWAENLWLPNITKFSGTIVSANPGATGTYKVAENSTNVAWIRNNVTSSNPATLLKINKNSSIPNGLVEITYPLTPNTTTKRWAYNYYDPALSAAITSNTINSFNAFYSNPSNVVANSSGIVSFGPFSAGGKPGAPLSITATAAVAFQLSTQWDRSAAADIENAGEGTISSYDISYNTIGSTIRYDAPISQIGSINVASSVTSAAILSNLYPDASYNIYVAAINDSNQKGDYTGLTGPVCTLPLPEPLAPVAAIVLDAPAGACYATPATIYKVSDIVNPLGTKNLYKSATITTIPVDAPIHRLAHRGLLAPNDSVLVGADKGAAGSIMKLTAVLDGVAKPDFYFQRYPIPQTTPTPVTSLDGLVEISTTGVADCITAATPSRQGFYLKASGASIKINTNGLTPGNTAHTLQMTQDFSVGSASQSNTASFYYENTVIAPPSCTIDTVTATPLPKVSGIAILTTGSTISVTTTATNMGTYFYRSPLASYYINNDTTPVKSETNLANITSGKETNKFTDGELKFSNSFTSPVSTYNSSIMLKMKASNIFGDSSIISNTLDAITDVPSYTFAYTTLKQSVQTLATATLTTGCRILSVASASTDLRAPATVPDEPTLYDNAALLTEGAYTTELLIANGAFLTPTGTSYYTTYMSKIGNSTVDYGATKIPASGYRFASFCWAFPTSLNAYLNLWFTIKSIYNPTANSNLLQMNGQQIQLFYAIRDTTVPTEANRINTVWINANSNENPVTSGNYYLSANNGLLGGSVGAGVTLSNQDALIKAFIPLTSVNANTKLYLRIAVPMNVNIQFGSVHATVSGNV